MTFFLLFMTIMIETKQLKIIVYIRKQPILKKIEQHKTDNK